MTFDHPTQAQTAALLSLWKRVFGEYNGFWELFLETAFSPDHCRCVLIENQPAAALCWLDCQCGGQKLAYIYAVVTYPDHRGKGLCRRLLADVHTHLALHGYHAAILVPAEESLRHMYRKLGYTDCTTVTEFSCPAGASPENLRAIGPSEYAALRRSFLPELGVIQEGTNLDFLSRQAQFYAGSSFLLAAYTEEDTLHTMELLGSSDAAPDIVTALGCRQGHFRIPGREKPFAMLCPLAPDAIRPNYFGFAFD